MKPGGMMAWGSIGRGRLFEQHTVHSIKKSVCTAMKAFQAGSFYKIPLHSLNVCVHPTHPTHIHVLRLLKWEGISCFEIKFYFQNVSSRMLQDFIYVAVWNLHQDSFTGTWNWPTSLKGPCRTVAQVRQEWSARSFCQACTLPAGWVAPNWSASWRSSIWTSADHNNLNMQLRGQWWLPAFLRDPLKRNVPFENTSKRSRTFVLKHYC